MRTIKPTCRICDAELNSGNWAPYNQKNSSHICKKCDQERVWAWRKANPEKYIEQIARTIRKRGDTPLSENKECPAFLGVYVAERVLAHVFKNVQKMPYGNPGYDFICGGGYMVDVKSSCRRHHRNIADQWTFQINKNQIAEYFLCLAFDNRDDLNPEHIWLIPAGDINDHTKTAIAETRLDKWDQYKLDVDRVVACCNTLKQDNTCMEA